MQSTTEIDQFIHEATSKKYATPYMLTDIDIIQEKCREFKRLIPGVKLFYALKCFNDKEVVRALDGLVDGYDIASTREIKELFRLNVHPSRITFSNPVKSEAALREATKLGVKNFAFQSANELIKIKKYAPESNVYIRLKVSDVTSSIAFSSKFGVDPSQAVPLMVMAKSFGLKPVGVTFHVGSQATDDNVWLPAIMVAKQVITDCKKAGIKITTLNLGGGFPVRYSSKNPPFSATANNVNAAIRAHAKDVPQVMAEPGRFLVADSSVIVTKVIGIEDRNGATWLYLDVGAFQAFVEIFEFGHFPYPVYSLTHLLHLDKVREFQNYVLTGPSCDSYDTIATSVRLPKDLAVGDKLIIGMTGAYTVVYGSAFNGFKVPLRKFISGKSIHQKTVQPVKKAKKVQYV